MPAFNTLRGAGGGSSFRVEGLPLCDGTALVLAMNPSSVSLPSFSPSTPNTPCSGLLFTHTSECSDLLENAFYGKLFFFLSGIIFNNSQRSDEIGSAHHLRLFSFPRQC